LKNKKQTSPLLADEKVLPLNELFLDGTRYDSIYIGYLAIE
jgi:hypothetical protein